MIAAREKHVPPTTDYRAWSAAVTPGLPAAATRARMGLERFGTDPYIVMLRNHGTALPISGPVPRSPRRAATTH